MTQQSCPHSQEPTSSASSTGNSATTSTTDVYPLPFSLGQKEIVQNSDGRRLVTDLVDNNVVAPGGNICIIDSSEVTVGNGTYFNGDVTINQYITGNRLSELQNGAAGQDEVQCNKNVTVVTSETKSEERIIKKCQKGRGLYVIFAFITLCLIGVSIIAAKISTITGIQITPGSVKIKNNNSTITTTIATTKTTPTDNEPEVPRSKWNGTEAKNVTYIPPVDTIVIKHTGGAMCLDTPTCKARVKQLQTEDMEEYQMPDIQYNFLIGGDEKVYVGRGWGVKNEGKLNDTIDIAFIGNFSEVAPSQNMLETAETLMFRGYKEKHNINHSYCVVAHNNTEPTDSPGKKLYEVMKIFQHWCSTIIEKNRTVHPTTLDVNIFMRKIYNVSVSRTRSENSDWRN